MMNFDLPIDRFGTNCYKYDTMPYPDTIPLWVADMDFETAPVVTDALKKRLEHGCFGYTAVPDSFYEATINWFGKRHGWKPERNWFIYTSGVVPAISAIIKAMTEPGDKVLVQTPVYNCFFSSIRNNGCIAEEAPLTLSGNDYIIDFEAFEHHCADEKTKVFILCNPHNPAGRVWSVSELQKMGEICKRNGVFIIADEIHCEFVNPTLSRTSELSAITSEEKPKYHPFMAVSDAQCAVCVSPSKAFNIAGLQIANIIVKDDSIRRRVDRAININEVCDVNPFGVIALQAAYTQSGEEWLNALNDYIYANYDYVRHWLSAYHPEWKAVTLEGTYLMWVDVSASGMDGDAFAEKLLHDHHIYVNSGSHYGKAGKNFIRINLATQRKRLEEAFARLERK